jgi:hypothetical protein
MAPVEGLAESFKDMVLGFGQGAASKFDCEGNADCQGGKGMTIKPCGGKSDTKDFGICRAKANGRTIFQCAGTQRQVTCTEAGSDGDKKPKANDTTDEDAKGVKTDTKQSVKPSIVDLSANCAAFKDIATVQAPKDAKDSGATPTESYKKLREAACNTAQGQIKLDPSDATAKKNVETCCSK